MASLLKLSKFLDKNIAIKAAYCGILRRHASDGSLMAKWNWNWKPSKVPTTPEERAIAAEKYGLRPEDYKALPDEGFAHGDYPDLPPVSQNSRDPYEDWDMPEIKKNYKEPLSKDYDMMREELYDLNATHRYSMLYMLTFIFGILGFNFGIVYLTADYPRHKAMLKKQLPADLKEGEIHYTFNPAQ